MLDALQFTLAGKVDCIYIDPPYNTGARDWKYDNKYIDDTDAYRHSKWLAFMERRLPLAKELLNPENSVLIVVSRRNDGSLAASIVDPHGHLANANANAKGKLRALAKGADGTLRALDLLEPHIRQAVRDFDGAKVSALYDSAAAGPFL